LWGCFQGFHGAEEGAGTEGKLHSTKPTFLTAAWAVFLNNFSLDCCLPLVDFQSCEYDSFDSFAGVLITFMEEMVLVNFTLLFPLTFCGAVD
jgi:hypothetical protein